MGIFERLQRIKDKVLPEPPGVHEFPDKISGEPARGDLSRGTEQRPKNPNATLSQKISHTHSRAFDTKTHIGGIRSARATENTNLEFEQNAKLWPMYAKSINKYTEFFAYRFKEKISASIIRVQQKLLRGEDVYIVDISGYAHAKDFPMPPNPYGNPMGRIHVINFVLTDHKGMKKERGEQKDDRVVIAGDLVAKRTRNELRNVLNEHKADLIFFRPGEAFEFDSDNQTILRIMSRVLVEEIPQILEQSGEVYTALRTNHIWERALASEAARVALQNNGLELTKSAPIKIQGFSYTQTPFHIARVKKPESEPVSPEASSTV